MSDQIATRWSGAINPDSELGRAIVDIRDLAAQCEALEKQSARFKEIGQGFERDYRNTFEQSCKNLQRAEAAESALATLTARCEALEQEKAKLNADIAEFHDIVSGYDAITDPEAFPELHERAFKAIGDDVDHTICRALAAAESRCEALTAERDIAQESERVALDNLRLEVREAATVRSRCQHLEQAVKAALAISTDDYIEELQQIRAALASLLPAQEEPTQTDENRLSFAAGYSQSIDDVAQDGALKGTK